MDLSPSHCPLPDSNSHRPADTNVLRSYRSLPSEDMSSTIGDGTVVGDLPYKPLEDNFSNLKIREEGNSAPAHRANGKRKASSADDFVDTRDYLAESRPFLVPIGRGGVMKALQALNEQMAASGRPGLISSMDPTDWTGREVYPGQMGLIDHGGSPELLLKPGRYPGLPLRNWWARKWRGTVGLSDTVIEFLGLTIVQVSQNQAAVISDPQNHVFVLKNAGFVAYAMEGTYDVLSIVDQTHLSNVIKDPLTKIVLGSTHEVKMRSTVGGGSRQDYVVATFLNLPASNCAILQKGNDLELLGAGQSVITNPSVTVRGLFTLGENQIEMPTKDIYTRDQVPVSLTIYLKWQLTEPLKLTTHGYNSPYDALRDKTQSILTQIVAHLDYSAMVKQRSLGPDHMDDRTDPSAPFLDALRTRAMDDMHEAALEYGIVLKDLAVINRQFKGEIASTMDKLTTRALEAQVDAANVDRENSNKVKQEEGALSVTRIKAQSANTQADTEAYRVIAAAKAQAQRVKIEAEANAEATRMQAKAEAEAILIRAKADAEVTDPFAREMQLRRIEVERVKAFGSKTVFIGGDSQGAGQLGSTMALGMAASMGAKAAGDY